LQIGKRADWEKCIKEGQVRIGLKCHRRRRRMIRIRGGEGREEGDKEEGRRMKRENGEGRGEEEQDEGRRRRKRGEGEEGRGEEEPDEEQDEEEG
jgi:hypothetical protein